MDFLTSLPNFLSSTLPRFRTSLICILLNFINIVAYDMLLFDKQVHLSAKEITYDKP
jgi:hypothetical protein